MIPVIQDTIEQRMEKFNSWQDHHSHYLKKGVEFNPKNNVIAVLTTYEDTEILKDWIYGANLLTNDGDVFYAKRTANEVTAPVDFIDEGSLVLRNSSASPGKGDTFVSVSGPLITNTTDYQSVSNTYPKTADTDPDNGANGGPKVLTWLYEWTKTQLIANGILGGAITHHSSNPPVNLDRILNHFDFDGGAFNKTDQQALRVFINHSLLGE